MQTQHLVTILELAVGPLPATILLFPFAIGGAIGSGFAVFMILADRTNSFSTRATMLLIPGVSILWTLSAMLGVSALWFAVITREMNVTHRPRVRNILVIFLLVGIVAAVPWLVVMGTGRETFDRSTWAVWIVLLLGPIVVGSRHLLLLVMERRDTTG